MSEVVKWRDSLYKGAVKCRGYCTLSILHIVYILHLCYIKWIYQCAKMGCTIISFCIAVFRHTEYEAISLCVSFLWTVLSIHFTGFHNICCLSRTTGTVWYICTVDGFMSRNCKVTEPQYSISFAAFSQIKNISFQLKAFWKYFYAKKIVHNRLLFCVVFCRRFIFYIFFFCYFRGKCL